MLVFLPKNASQWEAQKLETRQPLNESKNSQNSTSECEWKRAKAEEEKEGGGKA